MFLKNILNLSKKQSAMAITIKSIPTLKEKEAKAFNKKAEVTFSHRATVDFSKQVKSANVILHKAKLR
jgi:hypothetical protein